MDGAVLKIYGDIGESQPGGMFFDEVEMISAKTVSEFLDANKEAADITVRINSRGGDVQEGWAIHDLLVNSGKRIRTIGEGKVYSIATIVFLSGIEREIMKNADGLIHNPFIPPYTLADKYESDDLDKIAQSLRQEEAKILDFYVSVTGSSKEILEGYMDKDTKLSAEDMLTLGFATKIIEPIRAYAYIKPKNNFNMDEKAFFEKLGWTLDSAIQKIAGFSRLSSKNQLLTDMDGKELTLEKETGVPAVGDKATPDGTYVMESGKTITVSGGVITDILEGEPPQTELEKANAKIAELEAKITDLDKNKIDASAEQEALNAEKAVLEAETAKAVALVTELSNLKNSWKPDARGRYSAAEKVGAINLDRVRELNEKIKNSKSE